jgi:ribosomal-protein-alanine N-acetyltransferase
VKTAKIKDFYQNLPYLETTRLSLRKVTKDDVLDMYAYSSDIEVTRFLRWGPHQTVEDTENYISYVLVQYREGQDGPWAIELKQVNSIIGHIHLMEIDVLHRKAQIGFVLSKGYWNKGIMTEALITVLEYSFEKLGLNRLEGLCISSNQAAIRVLEKVGMVKEGELREYYFQKGTFWDIAIYAILKKEFRKE